MYTREGAMGKKLLLVLALLLVIVSLCYAEWANGYNRSNGAYVNAYNRSESNGTVTDNYSYKGNTNPYTGQAGSNYYRHSRSSQYYQGD